MQLSNIPGKLVLPFANAGGKSTIPVASQIGITAGAASLTDGFPPLTRTPIAAGGVPPSGLDMNGILYEMSAIIRWANAGGGYPFDGTFAADTNVGGYPKGARIMRSDGTGYWFNTAENNVTDPESAGAAAAGWVPDYTSGVATVAMASSSVTLTPEQYGKPVIVITGTLTANLNLIFPNIEGAWVIINNATGNYSITAKTAAGIGVSLIRGTNAIFGDSTNIYNNNSFNQNVPGSQVRTLNDKGRESVSVDDFIPPGTDITTVNCSPFVQLCVDYAISNNHDVLTPRLYRLATPVNIDRLVDDPSKASWFSVYSHSSGGFIVDSTMNMFDSSLPYVSTPVSQLINFQGVRFVASSETLLAHVLDGRKFLRTMFCNCSFVDIACLSHPTGYIQSIYFYFNEARGWAGKFVSAFEGYNIDVIGGMYEQGEHGFDIRNLRQGKFWTLIEGLSGKALTLSGAGLDVCSYFEYNNVDIDFRTHGLPARGVNLHGNWTYRNIAGAAILWGNAQGCTSHGNYLDGVAGSYLHDLQTNSIVDINDFSETVLSNTDATFNSGYRTGNCPLTMRSANFTTLTFGAQESLYRKIGKQVFIEFIGTLTITGAITYSDLILIDGGFPYQPESEGYLCGQIEITNSSEFNGISPLHFKIGFGFYSSLKILPICASGTTFEVRGQLIYRAEVG